MTEKDLELVIGRLKFHNNKGEFRLRKYPEALNLIVSTVRTYIRQEEVKLLEKLAKKELYLDNLVGSELAGAEIAVKLFRAKIHWAIESIKTGVNFDDKQAISKIEKGE